MNTQLHERFDIYYCGTKLENIEMSSYMLMPSLTVEEIMVKVLYVDKEHHLQIIEDMSYNFEFIAK